MEHSEEQKDEALSNIAKFCRVNGFDKMILQSDTKKSRRHSTAVVRLPESDLDVYSLNSLLNHKKEDIIRDTVAETSPVSPKSKSTKRGSSPAQVKRRRNSIFEEKMNFNETDALPAVPEKRTERPRSSTVVSPIQYDMTSAVERAAEMLIKATYSPSRPPARSPSPVSPLSGSRDDGERSSSSNEDHSVQTPTKRRSPRKSSFKRSSERRPSNESDKQLCPVRGSASDLVDRISVAGLIATAPVS
jgi:hypothetical protein